MNKAETTPTLLCMIGGTKTLLLMVQEFQVVTTPFQDRFEFAMDPFRKQCLISGQDEIGLTLGMANVITAHEARLSAERPWIAGAAHRVS